MNAERIIREVQESAGEYLEEVNDPGMFIAWILADKIIKLENHIEYLERVNHASTSSIIN